MSEMSEMFNLVVKEDDSINEKIQRTAEKLEEKFTTKRKVNEKKLLKTVPKWKKVLSVVVDIILIAVCVICCIFGVTSFLFKSKKLPPTFAGYSFMRIKTGSMIAAGFDPGDAIVVRRVDTKTLNVGDYIAFYVYANDYNQFHNLETELIEKEQTKHKYPLNIQSFFGMPNETMQTAASFNSSIVFHEIIRVYEDENGMLWFKTKGKSELREDHWTVSERMVVGLYDGSKVAQVFSLVLQALSSSSATIFIVGIPLVLMSFMFVIKCIKNVQLAKLELDCIEEKRKITDEICVKNNIGFNMSKRDKYKILAQATPDERKDYLALLWKDGSTPEAIKKYVLRKYIVLKPMEKMLEVNRNCEKMYAEGKDSEDIAKYYLKEKEKVEKKQQRYKKLFKKLRIESKKAKKAKEETM